MYDGKTILLTIISMYAGLDKKMSVAEGEKLIKNNSYILRNISIKELYNAILSLKEEHLSKVLGFLVTNYFKMHPYDQLFYDSFKDGDLQKVYDLIVKNPCFFNDLIECFYDYLQAGKYPEVPREEHYKILNMAVATGEVSVLFVDSLLASTFDYLFEAMEKANDFSTAASFLAKIIFQNAPYKTSIDISYEVEILRGYNIYLFKMLHAEVYAQISNGLLNLDPAFEEIFMLVLSRGVQENLPTDYLVSLIKYYFLAKRIGENNSFPDKIIKEARFIDPLFNESR